ncbi:hypothetical protein BC628DRAFT_220192 [Trametes gibbosa]|nr:hypothetical protein BC628DRAFT_220192 [Trametes gibbosa]
MLSRLDATTTTATRRMGGREAHRTRHDSRTSPEPGTHTPRHLARGRSSRSVQNPKSPGAEAERGAGWVRGGKGKEGRGNARRRVATGHKRRDATRAEGIVRVVLAVAVNASSTRTRIHGEAQDAARQGPGWRRHGD